MFLGLCLIHLSPSMGIEQRSSPPSRAPEEWKPLLRTSHTPTAAFHGVPSSGRWTARVARQERISRSRSDGAESPRRRSPVELEGLAALAAAVFFGVSRRTATMSPRRAPKDEVRDVRASGCFGSPHGERLGAAAVAAAAVGDELLRGRTRDFVTIRMRGGLLGFSATHGP